MYADSTFLIPGNVSYEQAAPIFSAGYTVWSGLRWADPMPHERVAVLGIGGLGHLAVQYAKAAGFETIAISHSPDKDKMIRKLGADEIVRDGKSLAAAGGAARSFLPPPFPANQRRCWAMVHPVLERFLCKQVARRDSTRELCQVRRVHAAAPA
jgi:hypothetical protein